MEQKIFLLIAIFCIAQVKSDEYEETDNTEYPLLEDPIEIGVGYPGGFPKDVLLSDAISIWGDDDSKRECFQEKYSNGSDFLTDAIRDFSQEILEAANDMKTKLGTEPKFETLAQKIPDSAKELGDLLKEYQEQLSTLVKVGSIDKIKKLNKEYDDKIYKVEKELIDDPLKLKGETIKGSEPNIIVKNFENTRNTKLTNLTDAGQQVMELLKKCIEEKKE